MGKHVFAAIHVFTSKMIKIMRVEPKITEKTQREIRQYPQDLLYSIFCFKWTKPLFKWNTAMGSLMNVFYNGEITFAENINQCAQNIIDQRKLICLFWLSYYSILKFTQTLIRFVRDHNIITAIFRCVMKTHYEMKCSIIICPLSMKFRWFIV